MKKIIFILIFLIIIIGLPVQAQVSGLPAPGLTPDNPFYFFDTLGETFNLLITFDLEKKVTKALNYADEKITETSIMAIKDQSKAVNKASQRYQKLVNYALKKAEKIKNKNKEELETFTTAIAENIENNQAVLNTISENKSEEIKSIINQVKDNINKIRTNAIKLHSPAPFSEYVKFNDKVKSLSQEYKENCPAQGFDSWHYHVMCSINNFVEPPYTEEHDESGGPCPWAESGKSEKTQVKSEILTYMGNNYEAEGEGEISQSLMVECEIGCVSNNCPEYEYRKELKAKCDEPIYYIHNFESDEDQPRGRNPSGQDWDQLLDGQIAKECEIRGYRFEAVDGELKEVKEKDCFILENSCGYEGGFLYEFGWRAARYCCCSCPRPRRKPVTSCQQFGKNPTLVSLPKYSGRLDRCKKKCSDKTPYNECSANKPQFCENGTLINKCQDCGCPHLDQVCQPNGSCKVRTQLICQDSTPYFECSLDEPLYCDNGNLVNDCFECGCPHDDEECQDDGSCRVPTQKICQDGTPFDECSTTKPKFCQAGILVDHCYACGCPPGYECDSADGDCEKKQTCSDGTSHAECSITKPKYCDNATLIDNCKKCGCPYKDQVCQDDGTCRVSTQNICQDGTAYGRCSATKPQYCDNGTLVNNCSTCGCPSGQTCQTDGSCKVQSTGANFTCNQGTEIVQGIEYHYLIITVSGHTYKFPEFTCADELNYKIAGCEKVSSIPADKVEDQAYVTNLFYYPLTLCEPLGEGEVRIVCENLISPLGMKYGYCAYYDY